MDPMQLATEMIRAGVAGNTGLGANIKFAFDDLGSVYVHGKGTPATVNNDDSEADLEVRMPIEYFQAIMQGRVDGARLLTSGGGAVQRRRQNSDATRPSVRWSSRGFRSIKIFDCLHAAIQFARKLAPFDDRYVGFEQDLLGPAHIVTVEGLN